MKKLILFISGVYFFSFGQAQTMIRDRAIEAQQERMVFKQWDEDKFYPKPNRILGIPTNPNWYITWALHPDYPKLDRRPLSASGEQTQRLGLAMAMQVSSDYYKAQSDTVKTLAVNEISRISGALSSTDPLYILYYKKELKPLENPEAGIFDAVSAEVQTYMLDHGSYAWYIENMNSLSERYGFAKTLDMERGQRLLMYHRLMLEMRQIIKSWEYKLAISEKMLAMKRFYDRKSNGQVVISDPINESQIMKDIILKRKALQ